MEVLPNACEGWLSRHLLSILSADSNPPAKTTADIGPRDLRRWGPLATVAWTSAAGAVYILAQLIGLLIFMAWWTAVSPNVPIKLAELETNGPLLAIVLVVSTPAIVGVFALAAYLSRAGIKDYLGLYLPSGKELTLGLFAMALIIPLSDFATWLSGLEAVPEFMSKTYESAKAMGMLPLLALAFVVMAPVGEEIAFRGFLYRGLAPRLGPVLAIGITAAVWGGLHVQYGFFLQLQILLIGLVLGWLRWRTGSTILTIILHGMMNAVAFAQVAWIQGV